MPVIVRIPTPLRPLAGGKDEVELPSGTVRQVVDSLEERHHGLKPRLCDASGQLRRFVNLFVNDEDIRQMDGLETPLKDGDVLAIVPAIAGGGR